MGSQLCIIGFDHFKISCIVGIEPDERLHEQEIFVDIRVQSDVTKCIATGSIDDTVDYVRLSKVCEFIAQTGKYFLLESYTSEVLDAVLNDKKVSWAWIRVKKPKALLNADYTVVEMEKGERACNHGH